jgi:ribosomal protein S17
MKISDKNIRILRQLLQGEVLSASSAKTKLIDVLTHENLLIVSGKHKKTIRIKNEHELYTYFSNQYQIDLKEYLALENINNDRASFTKITNDSKDSTARVFKGFLVNSYQPLNAILNNKTFQISPAEGSFIFIYDFENFIIDPYITIVGIENAENFRQIQKQKYLFNKIKPLFVSRYPQNQSKDLIKWLKSIPNKYLHFGDFDLSGVGIYLNEYKKHLGEKARFFIPETIDTDLKEKGNRKRYDIQKQNFKIENIKEVKLIKLVKLIHKYKKGLDQEFYINV